MIKKNSFISKEIIKGILFLVCFYLFHYFISTNDINKKFIQIISSENIVHARSLLTKTYISYLMFFLKIGHLLLFIYLIKSLYRNSKKSYIYKGVIYFSLGIFFENIGSILYFEKLSRTVFILGIAFYVLGILKFVNYFIDKTLGKNSNKLVIEFLLIILSSLFLSFSKLDIQTLKDFFNAYLSGVVLFFVLWNTFLFFYKKDFFEKKEALTFTILFGFELILYFLLLKFIELNNFEIISLIVLNFVIVDLRKDEYQNKKEVEQGINTNYIRILLIFLLIGIFSKIINISGLLTLFLIVLIIGELIFFTFTIESDYNLKSYNLLLNKVKIIENKEKMILFLEDELTKYFRFVDIKVILYSIDIKVKSNYKECVFFNSEYKNSKFDLEVRLLDLEKEIGKIYIKDSCMILNKKKLKRFLYLIEKLTPILENLTLKEVQVEYYKSNKNEILEKLDELEKENYYLKEVIKLKNKKEGI